MWAHQRGVDVNVQKRIEHSFVRIVNRGFAVVAAVAVFFQGNIFACSLNYWFHVAAVCSPALGPAQLKSASLGPSLPKIAYQMLVIACNVLHVHRARWHRFIWSDYSTDYSAYKESLIQLNSARHCVREIESIYTKPFAMPEYTSPIQCARKHHQSQAY